MSHDTRDDDYNPDRSRNNDSVRYVDELNAAHAAKADVYRTPRVTAEDHAAQQRAYNNAMMGRDPARAAREAEREARGKEHDRMIAEVLAQNPGYTPTQGTLRSVGGGEVEHIGVARYEGTEDRIAAVEVGIMATVEARGQSVSRNSVVTVPVVGADGTVVRTYPTSVAVAQQMGLVEEVAPGIWRDTGRIPLANGGFGTRAAK